MLGGVNERARVKSGLTANDLRSLVRLVPNGRDAFLARATLAGLAERSLDLQYYIWHNDDTGQLLLAQLLVAADRGVRVRLLLDDIHTADLEPVLAALDGHAHIDVRLYNPFAHRSMRLLDYTTDLSRVNRRMHNKAFIADGQSAVVGGRNVGNEYFAAQSDVSFGDMDAITLGPVVKQVAEQFDLYWNSASAWPAARLLPKPNDAALDTLRSLAKGLTQRDSVRVYLDALRDSSMAQDLVAGRLTFEPAQTTLVYDDPSKTLGTTGAGSTRLLDRLLPLVADTQEEMLLISPYFVPRDSGAQMLISAQARGVRTTVLTNSLASNDVGAVHAGYAKHRDALLAGGVSLWEIKPAPGPHSARNAGAPGSSSVSLHAKTFVFDRRKLFVGSFNLDPRSSAINTELGVLIESPALARSVAENLVKGLPQAAWSVQRDPATAGLSWVDQADGGRRYDGEPETGWLRRFGIGVLKVLPIDTML
jgi:putative cardiolipin synthase